MSHLGGDEEEEFDDDDDDDESSKIRCSVIVRQCGGGPMTPPGRCVCDSRIPRLFDLPNGG